METMRPFSCRDQLGRTETLEMSGVNLIACLTGRELRWFMEQGFNIVRPSFFLAGLIVSF
jgi:hypothetical protein